MDFLGQFTGSTPDRWRGLAVLSWGCSVRRNQVVWWHGQMAGSIAEGIGNVLGALMVDSTRRVAGREPSATMLVQASS